MSKSKSGFLKELTDLINKYSLEGGSDTPDFVLADYLGDCLTAYENALDSRDLFTKSGTRRGGCEGR